MLQCWFFTRARILRPSVLSRILLHKYCAKMNSVCISATFTGCTVHRSYKKGAFSQYDRSLSQGYLFYTFSECRRAPGAHFAWVFGYPLEFFLKVAWVFLQIAWVSWQNQFFLQILEGKCYCLRDLRAIFLQLWVKNTQNVYRILT